jgi:hypothetical protein
VDEGNQDKIDGLINWRKREQIFSIIHSVQQYQNFPYNLASVPKPIFSFLEGSK